MAITLDTRGASRKRMAVPAAASLAARTRAFAAARRHSRLVRFLRTMLPLTAVGIMIYYGATLALHLETSIGRLKVGGVTVTADDLIMKDPSYFGVTKDGGRYEVRAKRAIVGLNQNAPIKLVDIGGDLVQANKVTTKLKAKHGLFDNTKGELELFDGIDIEGSNGLAAKLSRAMVYQKEGKIVSKHPVTATTPTGSVRASAMTVDNKSHAAQFRGDVAVRMVPSAQGQVGIGVDSRQPVDIASDELDIDDAQKAAHFRGNVVAVQGETTMSTPNLLVKYEGKAAGGLATTSAPKQAGEQGTRVSFLWARSGVVINAGTDRRVTSDRADFNAEADTALFVGNVVVKQDKNVLRGQRLFIDRKAAKSRLESPGEGSRPPGRIAASFYQANAGTAAKAKPTTAPTTADAVQGAMFGTFKTDPNAPMEVDADTLDILDTSKQAVFNGSVKARQGDFVIRAGELTAFYAGQAGFGLGNTADASGAKGKAQTQGQLLRMEAKRDVLITSKDNQTAKADWANFDVKANTALLGGGVSVVKGKDIVEGSLLKIDLTTGFYRFEDTSAAPLLPKLPQAPATSSTSANGPETAGGGACPPGRQCMLVFPKDAKEKAKDLLKKAPVSDAR
jgi:lipopolysaccharide export system protein LptC